MDLLSCGDLIQTADIPLWKGRNQDKRKEKLIRELERLGLRVTVEATEPEPTPA
jgi:hypothetical protein